MCQEREFSSVNLLTEMVRLGFAKLTHRSGLLLPPVALGDLSGHGVPGVGVEPTRAFAQEGLSLQRLPVPPSWRGAPLEAGTGIEPALRVLQTLA